MPLPRKAASLVTTAVSLGIGAAGYLLASWLGAPAPVLVGPAVLVSLAGLAGVRTGIDLSVRDICFLVMGLEIGCNFNADAGAAILHFPFVFVLLGIAMVATIWSGRHLLVRSFGFDPRSAVLASAPGHLSFVLSMAAEMGGDVARVAVVQSIRLLALTLVVPFAAMAMGYELSNVSGNRGAPMDWPMIALMLVAGGAAGLLFMRLRITAPMVLGPMAVTGLTHVSGAVEGHVPSLMLTPAFLVLGTLIGTRFSGMSLRALRDSAMAGAGVTLFGAAIATAASAPVAMALDLPVAHVLVAFAPGGLETMFALGVVMGVSPGLVAACHIMRLLILTLLIPLALRWTTRQAA